MVRWVFRPYTRIRRLRFARQYLTTQASTKISPGFTMPEHSSPSFGSQHQLLYCSTFSVCILIRCQTSIYHVGQRCNAHLRRIPPFKLLSLRRVHFLIRECYDLHLSWTPWSVFQDGSNSWCLFRLVMLLTNTLQLNVLSYVQVVNGQQHC